MNRNDVYTFALVAVMVVAVAAAIVARYPGANFGSVADWFAAAASTFAAVSALYIAHHEAKRARLVLAEERAEAAVQAKANSEALRQERNRSDGIVVQTSISVLHDGIESCLEAISLSEGKGAEKRSDYIKGFLSTHRLKGPTAEFAMIAPSLAFNTDVTAWLLSAKGAWGTCMTRMTLLSEPTLTNERAKLVTGMDDVQAVLRRGYVLQWRLRQDSMNSPVPEDVLAEIESKMPTASHDGGDQKDR